jgi:hypothetical protein
MPIKTHFIASTNLNEIEERIEDFISRLELNSKDIIKIEHSRAINHKGEFITTVMLVFEDK